jgi:hypothetical protein
MNTKRPLVPVDLSNFVGQLLCCVLIEVAGLSRSS